MSLTPEQLQFVQHQLNYQFINVDRLLLCFKAAHRSDRDNFEDDGNRALAQFGVAIMEMIEKRCSCVVEMETRQIAHNRSEWVKSKDKRAAACDDLGFTPLITTSVRQGHEPPSKAVRASAISAIVAAVFEDLCAQGKTMDYAVQEIANLLGRLGTRSLGTLPVNTSELVRPASYKINNSISVTVQRDSPMVMIGEPVVEEYCCVDMADLPESDFSTDAGTQPGVFDMSDWIHFDEAAESSESPQPTTNVQESRGNPNDVYEIHDEHHSYDSRHPLSTSSSPKRRESRQVALARHLQVPLQQLLGGEQETLSSQSGGVSANSVHLSPAHLVLNETVEEPYATHLQYIFQFLGSSHSVVAFRRALCDLRGRIRGDDVISTGARSSIEHLRVVERLNDQSAANSMLATCHVMKLFEAEQDHLAISTGSFVVETQASLSAPRRAAVGNPLILAKAAITDAKMKMLYPNIIPGSDEYNRKRQYVTRLRKTATKLALFCNAFGSGILAFLPHADSLSGDPSLDNLLDIPNNQLSYCIKMLKESHGDYLIRLAAKAVIITESLIDGKFWSSRILKIEILADEEIIAYRERSDSLCDCLVEWTG